MLIPPGETVVETKSCKSCGISFAVTDRDIEFYDRVSPVFAGKKESIPTPTLCPDCRQRRRLVWRNERKLYKDACDLTGKDIISIYSPDKPYATYHQDAWWDDGWDAMEYGRGYDFSRTFSEQYAELFSDVPRMALVAFNNENSPYANFAANNRDIYLSPDILDSEAVYHSATVKKSQDCVDVLDVTDCIHSSECVASRRLHDCHHCIWSSDCSDCRYIFACHGLRDCLWCVNLHDTDHHILNKRVSEEEFHRALQDMRDGNTQSYRREYERLLLANPHRALSNISTQDSDGDVLENTKDSHHCYQSTNLENCRYVVTGYDMQDCMDTTIHNPDCELDYEAVSGGFLKNSCFNVVCGYADHILYCSDCFHSSHLFACIGLRHKQYCILNKQYTEEEYNTLVPKIIAHMRETGEWGEFFAPSLSPFGYNETVAMEYYPLTKEEALKQGFNWSDYEAPFPKVEKIIPANKLPENIKDIPDDILNWAIECEVTRKPYRIIKQELEFYRKHSLPIPRRHPDQRHLDRLALRNPRKLHERTCDNCSKDIVTTYVPDRPERVYCEECYRREVYA